MFAWVWTLEMDQVKLIQGCWFILTERLLQMNNFLQTSIGNWMHIERTNSICTQSGYLPVLICKLQCLTVATEYVKYYACWLNVVTGVVLLLTEQDHFIGSSMTKWYPAFRRSNVQLRWCKSKSSHRTNQCVHSRSMITVERYLTKLVFYLMGSNQQAPSIVWIKALS